LVLHHQKIIWMTLICTICIFPQSLKMIKIFYLAVNPDKFSENGHIRMNLIIKEPLQSIWAER